MEYVYAFAVLSFALSYFLGWILNSIISLLIRHFRPAEKNIKPALKTRASWAFFTGTIIFIIWVIVILRNVKMH